MAALRWGAETAVLHETDLTIVAVVAGTAGAEVADARTALLAESQRIAAKTAAELGGKLEITTELTRGDPADVLLNRARTSCVLALGPRGLGEFSSGLQTSVTSRIAEVCPTALVIVSRWPVPPTGAADLTARGPVVVGVDGSAAGTPAVATAFDEASVRGVPLVAVYASRDAAFHDPSGHDPNGHHPSGPDTDRGPGAGQGSGTAGPETTGHEILENAIDEYRVRHPEVKVITEVTVDRPVRRLVEASETAQLLVVGSRGRGGFTGMRLGSVSTALLHASACPLMIVRDH
ncbi:universal stress protein [Gordonia jinhuaensis]|uniref:Universal stress protein n=2 Tax=Gordonia jinhuaensis TaxID=1517702 RepID=A0A916T9C0_9ACTN|nr:universal stress protein [Gordonia jinhuaensis]